MPEPTGTIDELLERRAEMLSELEKRMKAGESVGELRAAILKNDLAIMRFGTETELNDGTIQSSEMENTKCTS